MSKGMKIGLLLGGGFIILGLLALLISKYAKASTANSTTTTTTNQENSAGLLDALSGIGGVLAGFFGSQNSTSTGVAFCDRPENANDPSCQGTGEGGGNSSASGTALEAYCEQHPDFILCHD